MKLLIDIGNTNIVAALSENGEIFSECRYATCKNESEAYHRQKIAEFTKGQDISFVIISSVVPEVNLCFEHICLELFGAAPIFVSSALNTGLSIKYDNPEKLGADLICAAAGAVKKYGAPIIVIDVGTATTFSVINRRREYLGGMIAPGPLTSIRALSASASQLPEITLEPAKKLIGTNTADCIRVGTITAHGAMIDEMLARVLEELREPQAGIVATGGLAELALCSCRHNITIDNNLIFSGLYELYKLNAESIPTGDKNEA